MKLAITGSLFFALTSLTAHAEVIYSNPPTTQLKAEPQMSAAAVAEVKRGTSLTVVKKSGVWYEVTGEKGVKGWISKLFVSPNKPVGEAELAAELSSDKNLAKAARKRASSYAVSASTRGLSAGNRSREGRETYQSDFTAVERMEKMKIGEEELRNFQGRGKLGE